MDLQLRGKVAIVTGGSRGIGKSIASTLASEGVNVAIADIAAEQARKAAAQMAKETGARVLPVTVDVSNRQETMAMARVVGSELGRVDILINNAAVLPGFTTFAEEAGSAELRKGWARFVDVCFMGVVNSVAAVLDDMIRSGGGRIINIASDAGKVGEPRQAVYAGAKGAIIAFTKSMAKELGRHWINVNAVCPSMTRTPAVEQMLTPDFESKVLKAYPLRRLGEPQDIANLVVFLASERAAWITGQAISVNGGYTTA